MHPRVLILFSSLLAAVVLLARQSQSSPTCNNQCCRLVEGFPVRLRKLREDYSQIRDYYEANDDLDSALLESLWSIRSNLRSRAKPWTPFWTSTCARCCQRARGRHGRHQNTTTLHGVYTDDLQRAEARAIKCRNYLPARSRLTSGTSTPPTRRWRAKACSKPWES
ncbi:hypothetical protein WMY93_032658 [Mugilogobius chulae]|uniref:Uncharacterized protein n=1 Tax=Mugilogobius chulae TaxID=88201 RepID=A0AAW0MJ05_9GOBI